MTAQDVLKKVRAAAKAKGLAVQVVEAKGSHKKVRVGSESAGHFDERAQTSIPFHAGEDLGSGLRRSIERDLEPALGKGWMR